MKAKILGAWIAAVVSLAAHCIYFWGVRVDDAYITFRIGRNLLQNGEPTFNLGERVEAYSNPLWMLLTSPAACLEEPMSAVAPLGLLLLIFNSWLTVRISCWLTCARPWAGPVTLLFLSFTPGWVYWHLSGLEVPLVASALLLALSSLLSQGFSRVYLFGGVFLLTLTRVDAFGLAALACALPLLHTGPQKRTESAMALALVLVTLLSLTAFRLGYFGSPLPNTYYAKVSSGLPDWGGAWSYLEETFSPLSVLFLGLVLSLQISRKSRQSRLRTVALFALACLAYQGAVAVRAGGDWMPQGRFFAALTPLLVLSVVGAMAARAALGGALALIVLPLAHASLSLFYFFGTSAHLAVIQTTEMVYMQRDLSRSLLSEERQGQTIATESIGALPFFSSLKTIDAGGLADAHIARTPESPHARRLLSVGHRRGDGRYILSRRPELLVFSGGRSATPSHYQSDVQIAFDPRFLAYYSLKEFERERGQHVTYLPSRHAEAPRLEQFAEVAFRKNALLWAVERKPLHLAVFERTLPDSPRREFFARLAEAEADRAYLRAQKLFERASEIPGVTPAELLVMAARSEAMQQRIRPTVHALQGALVSLPPGRAQLLQKAILLDPLFSDVAELMQP